MAATGTLLGQTTAYGSMPVAKPGEWGVTDAPAANTAASASKAAAAGKRHVCRSITASICSPATSTPGTAPLTLVLRDGASGAGTILWQMKVIPPPLNAAAVTGNWSISLTDLWLVGSTNTAMTLEFSGGAGATTVETAAMSGFTVGN